MNTDELISKVLEKTNYIYNKDIMFIMAYGSRIYHMATDHSDLDFLIISSKHGTYKQSLIIDNVKIDINIMSLENAQDTIYYSNITGGTFFDSILSYGKIVIDNFDIFNTLKIELDNKKRSPRRLNYQNIAIAGYHIDNLFNNFNSIDYFSTLEALRKIYHEKYNKSLINSSKVYDLYTNKKIAKEIFKVKLPEEDFIKNYLDALKEINYEKQKEYIKYFYNKVNYYTKSYEKNSFANNDQILMNLISIYNAIYKCKNLIKMNHPYAYPYYYMLIGEMQYFNFKYYHKDLDDACINNSNMIDTLEKLFNKINQGQNFDYTNYKIRIR